MVLGRIFSKQRKEESFEIDNPLEFAARDGEDCIGCRVFGSTALVSLGGYTYYSGMKGLKTRQQVIELSKSKYKYGSRQLGIILLSATLVGMGVYRTFN